MNSQIFRNIVLQRRLRRLPSLKYMLNVQINLVITSHTFEDRDYLECVYCIVQIEQLNLKITSLKIKGVD